MRDKPEHLVAIVDDDPSICEATISLLKANGLKTRSFCSASEFLDCPELDEIGCLILDLRLSGMSGLELQRHLAEKNRRIPVIFITSHGTPETREEAMRAGAVAFLSKPFSEEALLNSIRLALENPTNTEGIKSIKPIIEAYERNANMTDATIPTPGKEQPVPTSTIANPTLAQKVLDALDSTSGLHPGYRPAHAKGLMCSGTFTPSPGAAKMTRAPHAKRPSTPVTVRFSDSTGLPNIPDNDPARSGPRGMSIRFHLDEHIHTDIVAHSTNGFPVRTGEEFVEFLRAAAAFGAGQPEAMGAFLASHPNARRFIETPKPVPTSFVREAFYAVTSFKFTNADSVGRHGRFRIRPEAGTEYLSNEQAAGKSANFLFDEIGPRLAKAPVKFGVFVQLAEPGDDVTDASVAWPDSRKEIPFGTITLTARVDEQTPERRKIIFDPLPRIDGIDSSGDPLTDVRADVYLLSGRRRRAALGDGGKHA